MSSAVFTYPLSIFGNSGLFIQNALCLSVDSHCDVSFYSRGWSATWSPSWTKSPFFSRSAGRHAAGQSDALWWVCRMNFAQLLTIQDRGHRFNLTLSRDINRMMSVLDAQWVPAILTGSRFWAKERTHHPTLMWIETQFGPKYRRLPFQRLCLAGRWRINPVGTRWGSRMSRQERVSMHESLISVRQLGVIGAWRSEEIMWISTVRWPGCCWEAIQWMAWWILKSRGRIWE